MHYGYFELFNPNIKTVASQTGHFMNSGKVGGWRSKLTILQGRFLSEINNSIDKFTYGIAFHVKILISSRTLHQMPS